MTMMMDPPPDPTGGRADIAALHDLIEESKQLRADMHATEMNQRFRFRWMMVFLGVLGVAVAGLVTLAVQNQRISAQIADCTNQGGACWEESRQRSKTNVTAVLNTTMFVAECLNQYSDMPRQRVAFEDCVRQEIAAGRQPVPIPSSPPPRPDPSPPAGAR